MSPSPPNTQKSSSPKTEYAFVTQQQQGDRSHAMREHWKQRRHKKDLEKKHRGDKHRRALLPTPSTSTGEASDSVASTDTSETFSKGKGTDSAGGESFNLNPMDTMLAANMENMMNGIPGQAISGMNLALGSSRLDPFDKFPIKLTSRHHMLLHHWLSTYASMMFDDMHVQAFNPMRDVWCPLDLSNAASFNALMAHSAAHLARMQGLRESKEAIKFKVEAVRIVKVWMDDPELALSDDVLAAVLRLLTYERYWGTEAEWHIHYNGLSDLITARGGIQALQSNWRLELTTFLVSLMSKPSWFDCSNQIDELSSYPSAHVHPVLGDTVNLHRVRCLWLLSFVQDVGTFRTNSPDIYSHGMTQFPAIQEALKLLKQHLRQNEPGSTRDDVCTDSEFTRLACLFFICILLQQSISESSPAADTESRPYDTQLITYFNQFLDSTKPMWHESIDNLYNALFNTFDAGGRTGLSMEYIQSMTGVMALMTGSVRYGVERCLYNILCRTEKNHFNAFDTEWTPDSLLSQISEFRVT